MNEIIKSISDYFKRKKRLRTLNKEYNKEYKKKLKEKEKFDKEINKELKQKRKEEKREKRKIKWYIRLWNYIADFWKDMTDTKDEKELISYMTPEELKKRKQDKIEDKIFLIGGMGTLAIIITVVVVIYGVVREATKTDLESKVIPALDKYMETNFPNRDDKRVSIEYLSYKQLNEEKRYEIITTDIVLATYESGLHLMSINDDVIGDDINYGNIYSQYNTFIREKLNSVSIYDNNPLISFNPYIVSYYYYKDYIDVLPGNKEFIDMYNESNITVVDMIKYEGELDLNIVKDVLSMLGDNSFYYLVQVEGDRVFKFSKVTKNEILTYDVTRTRTLGDNDTYYELDTTKNLVSDLSITVLSDLINDDETLQFTTVRRILPSGGQRKVRNDNRTNYFMVKIGDSLNKGEYTFLQKESLIELGRDEYPTAYYMSTSNGTFVFGEAEIVIANKSKYTSPAWYCRFGICK